MNQDQKTFRDQIKLLYRQLILIFSLMGIVICFLIYMLIDPNFSSFNNSQTNLIGIADENSDRIENGIHIRTGLVEAEGLMEVVNNCTNCHSAKLVTQNRMDKARWASTIDWMQRTQNLWDLGPNEDIIIDYLVKNYPPQEKGRRQALKNIEWYELEE